MSRLGHLVLTEYVLAGPQSRSGRLGEEKILLRLPVFESRTVQPFA